MFERSPVVTEIKEFDRFPENLVKIEYVSTCCDGRKDHTYAWDPPAGSSVGVIVLHGHGSHGEQLFTWPKLVSWCDALRENQCGLLAPDLRGNAWMSPEAVTDLADLILWAKEHFSWQKILICSASMGGSGGLIFAALRPELVDGLAVMGAVTDLESYLQWCGSQSLEVCGRIAAAIRESYGNDVEKMRRHSVCRHAENLTMPVLFYHGMSDQIIPVSQARRLAGLLADKADFYYTEMYQGDHDSPCAFMPECLERLLKIHA